ncbi:MAG: hypothetical protein JSS86_01295 [Cyanobacteria bacterium SZAS LIN-2]|nr:hypothetical protein [Cyanobacteria bacterium SZAS LIN-3]MBS1994907.1 hypothetical protein [Cyanobacteria bacterium SZAS LIN-2]
MSDNFRDGNASAPPEQSTSEALLRSAESPRAKQWEEASRASLHQPLKINSDGSYTVKDGDCLSTIAERELHMAGRKATRSAIAEEVAHIKQLNQAAHPRLAECDRIQEGWHLRLGLSQKRDCPPVEHHAPPPRHSAPEQYSGPQQPIEPRYSQRQMPVREQGGDFAQGFLAPLAGILTGVAGGLAGGMSHRYYGGRYPHPGFMGGFQQQPDYDYGYGYSSPYAYQRNNRYYPQDYSRYGNGYDDYGMRPPYRPLPQPGYGRIGGWFGGRF